MVAMQGTAESIKAKFVVLQPWLDERTRRLWAAVEAQSLGRGGISRVAAATGLSRNTVRGGLRELESGAMAAPAPGQRQRRPGGGRPRRLAQDPQLATALERKLEAVTRGDPMAPLRWTCASAARLAQELRSEGHTISERTVNRLLHGLGYSLQANRKTLEGKQHPDRDAQFLHINRRVQEFQQRGEPVVSVDANKKELVGRYRNAGREWQRKGEPVAVEVHDFQDPQQGKAIPYGVYDLTANAGWVSVGVDQDTAEFAVETRWRRCGAGGVRWAA